MPDGLLIPFAIETQRHNTVRIPVRNLVMATGDDTTLAITCYDDCGCPFDISGGAVTLTLVEMPQDPGGRSYAWSGYGGIGWDGWDYGAGWFTYRDRIVFQQAGTLTNPQCGQAEIIIPRASSTCWRGRYRFMVSLDTEYGGDVQTFGVLDVRRGSCIPRLGTAGFVSISDGVISAAGSTGMGLLDGIGIVDGTSVAFVPARIGVLSRTPSTGPQQAVFTVTLEAPAQQTVIVRWQTVDGSATADAGDYTYSEGVLTFLPGQMSQAITVPVRPYSNAVRDTEFTVHLCAGNGAVVITADGTATIPGWVGILDDVFVADGSAAPFVPGLVGVLD